MKPDIDVSLQGGIDMFERDVSLLWDNPADARALSKFADNIAKLIHDDVAELSSSRDGSGWVKLREVLSEHELREDLDYALQARLAWHLLPSFVSAGERCWHLIALVKKTSPPEQARRFLSRVTRCYLLGMDPECLVMCRGALENAVNARYATEQVAFPKNSTGYPSMKARLELAEKKEWLGSATAQDLHSVVWLRGSKAAHGDPLAVGDPLAAITLTLQAIGGLNPPPEVTDAT